MELETRVMGLEHLSCGLKELCRPARAQALEQFYSDASDFNALCQNGDST